MVFSNFPEVLIIDHHMLDQISTGGSDVSSKETLTDIVGSLEREGEGEEGEGSKLRAVMQVQDLLW